ncbi:MAG: NAD(P)H-hydrate dehydratase [Candidatus Cryptobacteroides sp.]
MLGLIPEGSVMTPHPGELRRLIPSCFESRECLCDGKERDAAATELCKITGCTVVAKAHRTVIYSYIPEKEVIIKAINTTGNAGMAKGGSGDVLTGLIGGLIARGYEAFDAAALGVWVHGFAGDCLTEMFTAEAYSSKDLIDYLNKGFLEIYR